MGYTHYWQGRFTEDEWSNLMPIAREIINLRARLLSRSYQCNTEAPTVDEFSIELNGVDEGAHEDFMLHRVNNHDFCKTARKPYDAVVVALLIAASAVTAADGDFSWSSDGDDDDHREGQSLYEEAVASLTDAFMEQNPVAMYIYRGAIVNR